MTDVLLCVGNSMMGDDGAGPLLAEMCATNPQGNWVVIDGGSAPENDVVAIRELRPERLLIVDATDMGLNPGEIRLIDPDDIAEMFMMTTHWPAGFAAHISASSGPAPSSPIMLLPTQSKTSVT